MGLMNPQVRSVSCAGWLRKMFWALRTSIFTLKHTFTSDLLSNSAQPKDVQELLGHADVSTTMNIYAHATKEAKRSSARLLDKVVGE